MAFSSRSQVVLLTLGVVACVAGAAVWWAWPRHTEFYTDADRIRQSTEDARLRDILWRPPESAPGALNSPADESEPRITADGDTMLLTRLVPGAGTDILIADRAGAGWGEPQPLASINSVDNEQGAALSADGRWLYFSSDRPGGLGGFDVWRAQRSENGWGPPEHLGDDVNSAADDVWPAPSPDGAFLALASDRPREADQPAEDEPADLAEPVEPTGFDLFVVDLRPAQPRPVARLAELATTFDELAPAFSPAGDFLYFASDRDTGRGGFDLYRTRVVDGAYTDPEHLGPEVNTEANELDPSLSMGGFALHFGSDRAPADDASGGYDVYKTVSREVFLGAETRYGTLADLLALLPWVLLALALVLLMSLLRRSARDEVWRVRWGTLSLMAKCLLVSLLAHASLLAMLSLWNVTNAPGDLIADDRTGVSLTSSALASSIQSQLQGDPLEAPAVEAAEAPTPTPSASMEAIPDSPASAQLEPAPSAWSDSSLAVTVGAAPAPAETAVAPSQSSTPIAPIERSRPLATATPEAAAPGAAQPEAAEQRVATLAPQTPLTRPRSPVGAGAPEQTSTLGEAVASSVGEPTALDRSMSLQDATVQPAPSARSFEPQRAQAPRTEALDLALPGAAPTPAEQPAEQRSDAIAQREATAPPMPAVSLDVAPADGEPGSPISPLDLDVTRLDLAEARDATPEIPRAELESPTLPPAAPALTLALPKPAEARPRLSISGVVVDADSGEPIEGATVRLDREAAEPLTATSDPAGAFALTPSSVPDHAAVTASKRGYLPDAVNVSEQDFERGATITLELEPHNPFIIALEDDPEVHHLGNDEFTGRVNSQFQRTSEGLRLTMRFDLDPASLPGPVLGAHIELLAKGVQLDNPIYLNGNLIGTLPESPADGSFGRVQFPVSLDLLREGQNTITLRSVDSPGTDVDDYEFVNVTVHLHPKMNL